MLKNGGGLALPAKRITVNLAPADVLKEGDHFDLPIALGLLAAMAIIRSEEVARFVALGELALDDGLPPVVGILAAAVHANALGCGLICAAGNGSEAVWTGEVAVLAAPNLLALINHFKAAQLLSRPRRSRRIAQRNICPTSSRDIKGRKAPSARLRSWRQAAITC